MIMKRGNFWPYLLGLSLSVPFDYEKCLDSVTIAQLLNCVFLRTRMDNNEFVWIIDVL